MTDAASFASALLALTILAFETIKSLHDAVSSFKSQRRAIKELQTDLNSLVALLGSIRAQAQSAQEVERLKPVQQPLECCVTTCQELHEMLDACTKHSAEGRDSIRDWLNMRYHEKSFDDMKKRLANYKATLTVTLEIVIHLRRDHSCTQDAIDNLQNSIRGTKEDLEDQLDQLRGNMSTAEASMRDMLQADQARLRECLESIERAQRDADVTYSQIIIKKNQADPRSLAVFGTDICQPKFNLDVSENKVGLDATVAAGVLTPHSLQALILSKSRTPDAHKFDETQLGVINSSVLPPTWHISPSIGQLQCPSSSVFKAADSRGLVNAPTRLVGLEKETTIECDKALG